MWNSTIKQTAVSVEKCVVVVDVLTYYNLYERGFI